MTVEEYIKTNVSTLGFRVLIAPDIDEKSMNECLKYVINEGEEDYVLAYGNADFHSGFAFTGDKLYFSNNKRDSNREVLFEDMMFVKYDKKHSDKKDNSYSLGDQISIVLKNRDIIKLEECMLGFDCKAMENLLNGIIDLIADGGETTKTRQNLSLDRMPEDAKLLYLKVLCNYTYIGDNVIDSDEYSSLQKIIVRIDAGPDTRMKIREYMTDIQNKEKTGMLLYKLKNTVEYGTFYIIRYSLMQDTLYFHYLKDSDSKWEKDSFIGGMLNALKLNPEQVDLMLTAVKLHQEMIKEDSDTNTIKKNIETMQKMAELFKVPRMTLYCSGSVYSYDSYNKIFGKKKKKQAIDKQRELILQTVIKNTQKTVNNLVEDMNVISKKLIEEVNKGALSREKINQLSLVLSKITKSASNAVRTNENMERKELYCRLPRTLDIQKLKSIEQVGDYKIQCNYILRYYVKDNHDVYHLQENLNISQLTRINEAFEEISYN